MKTATRILGLAVAVSAAFATLAAASRHDWRNASHGAPIYSNGYCDQPYVVLLENGKWLCVFTMGRLDEGSRGQHIVACTSVDQGKSWSEPVRIEEPGEESASWAMPYLTDYGRVYVFYTYNGDKIHELNGKRGIREDMLGWYCYKYSDDEGRTWSKRHRLDVRKTAVDLNNDWKGDVQILWGIGKPVDVDGGMMFAFTKVGRYMFYESEGWFFKCGNINTERDPGKLNWTMLPDSDHGVKNPALGTINAEHNIVRMDDGTLYCMLRTVSGNPAESYSSDGGASWTLPQPPVYENGIKLKNPRACPRIWKCRNGKYLFWHHNHGGWDFSQRSVAWISGGVERDGRILWSQPEILFYEEDAGKRMSYPDLIEQDGKYWITETNKKDARCHVVPEDFLNTIWSQFDRNIVVRNNLVDEWTQKDLEPGSSLAISRDGAGLFKDGFTIDLRVRFYDLTPGQPVLAATAKGVKGEMIQLKTGEYGSIEIILNDGLQTTTWNSDPGLLNVYTEHSVAVTVDNASRATQFVVDGTACNGRGFRQYGWSRFPQDMGAIDFNRIHLAERETMLKGRLTNLMIYNRPLMNTEVIGNHRSSFSKKTR